MVTIWWWYSKNYHYFSTTLLPSKIQSLRIFLPQNLGLALQFKLPRCTRLSVLVHPRRSRPCLPTCECCTALQQCCSRVFVFSRRAAPAVCVTLHRPTLLHQPSDRLMTMEKCTLRKIPLLLLPFRREKLLLARARPVTHTRAHVRKNTRKIDCRAPPIQARALETSRLAAVLVRALSPIHSLETLSCRECFRNRSREHSHTRLRRRGSVQDGDDCLSRRVWRFCCSPWTRTNLFLADRGGCPGWLFFRSSFDFVQLFMFWRVRWILHFFMSYTKVTPKFM